MFADRFTKDGSKEAGKNPAISLVKDFDKSIPEIPCYPADLNQVWTNIIDNAIAAMRDTGGTLTVTEGTHTAAIALLGNYMASIFVGGADGHGGTLVTETPLPDQPTLAHPHG